jgi:hypothetical protein
MYRKNRETKIPRRKSTKIERKIQIEKQRWVLDSIRLHGEFLAAQKLFLLFKGRGFFEKFFRSWRKCRVFKGISIDTTPPLPSQWSFYSTFNKCQK